MASPSPVSGIGITAIVDAPEASSARNAANKFAAASNRSPVGLRLITECAAPVGTGPNASKASPGSADVASSLRRARGA